MDRYWVSGTYIVGDTAKVFKVIYTPIAPTLEKSDECS